MDAARRGVVPDSPQSLESLLRAAPRGPTASLPDLAAVVRRRGIRPHAPRGGSLRRRSSVESPRAALLAAGLRGVASSLAAAVAPPRAPSRDEGPSRHVLGPPVVRRTSSTPPPCGPARVSGRTLLPRRPPPHLGKRLASLVASGILNPATAPPPWRRRRAICHGAAAHRFARAS